MIKLSNWNKPSIEWLNKVAYAGLGAVALAMGMDMAGFPIDWITDEQKKWLVIASITFKFIEKMTAKNDAKVVD